MRYRRWTWGAVLVLAVCLLLFLLRSRFQLPRASKLAPHDELNNRSASTPQLANQTNAPTTAPGTAAPTESQIQQARKEKWAAFFQTPISIHGKVVDEQGNPVPDATVQIVVNDNPNANATGSSHKQLTSSDGLFSLLNVTGIGFSVTASKTGYYETDRSTAIRNVAVPTRQDPALSSNQEPIVLVLRKQGQTVPLIAVRTGQINVPKTGQPVTVDLATGRIGIGDLQITSWVGSSHSGRFGWRYQLSLPSGGLVVRGSPFDFVAPVDGYQTSTEIDMPATAQNWSFDGDGDYFAKLADGTYARFSIKFYPREQRNFVVIESYVNPVAGDRNLEFDPAKQINSR